MLLFGHIGNTAGLVKLCQKLIDIKKPAQHGLEHKHQQEPGGKPHFVADRIQKWIGSIDYRLVLLGSMLPDIIDKPLWLLGRGSLNWAGRGYAHTFLLNFVLLAVGLILALRRNQHWLITMATSSFAHLVFDQMWLNPTALWWPLLGPIRPGESAGWFSNLWQGLFSNPYVYVSETLGFVITSYTAWRLLTRGRLRRFLRTGDIDWKETPGDDRKG